MKHLTTRLTFLAAVLAVVASVPHADAAPLITGKVIAVHDADTYTIAVKVRVRYIDAPELGQPHGKEAAQYVRDTLLGRSVDFAPSGRSYDRIVADVALNGLDVARLLTERGDVMLDPRYKPPQVLIEAQEDAKAERLGVWKQEKPEPAWEWRKRRKAK